MSMGAVEHTVFKPLWSGDIPLAEQDLLNMNVPFPLLFEMLHSGIHDQARAFDHDMINGVEAKGMQVSRTPLFELIVLRAGGYLLDQGAVPHILTGRIKIKSGVEVESFERQSVRFTDGSSLPADVVVLACVRLSLRADCSHSHVIEPAITPRRMFYVTYSTRKFATLWGTSGDLTTTARSVAPSDRRAFLRCGLLLAIFQSEGSTVVW